MTQIRSAQAGLEATGASQWEREIVALLERHSNDEGRLLSAYQHFVEDADSPAVRYLVSMILEDERRHHRAMAEIANAVAWGDPQLSPEPAVPDVPWDAQDSTLLAETRRLLEEEHADRRNLQELRDQIRGLDDTTLWPLLIELMMLDTDKHIRILERVQRIAAGK